MISYTKSAVSALASRGNRVNAVSHGGIAVPMWKLIDELIADFKGKEPEQKKREINEALPLGYASASAFVARGPVFLTSQNLEYMKAQTIGVDGGNVLR